MLSSHFGTLIHIPRWSYLGADNNQRVKFSPQLARAMFFYQRDLIEKHRASELWAEFHALVVIGAEVCPSRNYLSLTF